MPSRKEILDMLSKGQIDVDRATELFAQAQEMPAAPDSPPAPEPAASATAPAAPPPPIPIPVPAPAPQPPRAAAPPPPAGKRRWLHIDVTELDTGRSRMRVNVPLGLVRFGMRIGARFSNELDPDTISDVLRTIDSDEMVGTLLEVEDAGDNERVHIYLD